VRLGIGLGEIDFESSKITESNGSAFVRSGESFEDLKKQNIMFKSADQDLDEAINTMLGLSLYISNKWSVTVSEIIKLAIEKPNLKQKELAKQLGKSQSNISEALKRGGFDEIMAMHTYYKKQILKLC
jgi:ribosome-binding protein aMBF1 (putative translation factor)